MDNDDVDNSPLDDNTIVDNEFAFETVVLVDCSWLKMKHDSLNDVVRSIEILVRNIG